MAQVEVTVTLPVDSPVDTGRTFLQLQDEVLAHGFGPRYRPRVKTWLNEALGKLSRQVRSAGMEMESTITLTPGVRHYDIPGAVTAVMDVRNDMGLHMANVDRTEIDSMTGGGSPVIYTIFGGRLIIGPSPIKAGTLLVRYRGRPVRLSNDTDLSGLPSAYEDLLTHYALWHAYLAEDDPEVASYHKQEWNEGVAEFRRDSQLEDESESRQIVGMMSRPWIPRFLRP
jgi:hypothetical protein